MVEKYVKIHDLSVSEVLFKFINKDIIPESGINEKKFWHGFNQSVHKLSIKNKELLSMRERLQIDINRWHLDNKNGKFDQKKYEEFLTKIGYIRKEGADFTIKTKSVDDEISKIAGPQLVVPIMNARYALNAANARWISLYDSLYGSDLIESEESASERYDPERGAEVIKFAKNFLDENFELKNSSWRNVSKIEFSNKKLNLSIDGKMTTLKDENKFIGYRIKDEKLSAIILKNNNLHIEIIINPDAFSAKGDAAGISDIIVESAISTICDHEDSVAGVDAYDKVIGYKNWLGLMKGNLTAEFEKAGKKYVRKLNPDRNYISKDGKKK